MNESKKLIQLVLLATEKERKKKQTKQCEALILSYYLKNHPVYFSDSIASSAVEAIAIWQFSSLRSFANIVAEFLVRLRLNAVFASVHSPFVAHTVFTYMLYIHYTYSSLVPVSCVRNLD